MQNFDKLTKLMTQVLWTQGVISNKLELAVSEAP